MLCSKRPAQNDRLKNDQREQTGSERPAQNALLKTIGSGQQAQRVKWKTADEMKEAS